MSAAGADSLTAVSKRVQAARQARGNGSPIRGIRRGQYFYTTGKRRWYTLRITGTPIRRCKMDNHSIGCIPASWSDLSAVSTNSSGENSKIFDGSAFRGRRLVKWSSGASGGRFWSIDGRSIGSSSAGKAAGSPLMLEDGGMDERAQCTAAVVT